jgi:putative endonuclease
LQRQRSELRLGKPVKMSRFIYLYVLQSKTWPDRFYIGRTRDLRSRLRRLNTGQVLHTAKRRPWRIKTYLALSDARRVTALERYLKSRLRQSVYKEAPLTYGVCFLSTVGARSVWVKAKLKSRQATQDVGQSHVFFNSRFSNR